VTGVLDVPASQYHADDLCGQPTLSASVAHTLCKKSPAHARHEHPKLNPFFVREEKAHLDLGSVVHAVLLEGTDPLNVVEVCEFENWKSGAAREARDAARAAGKIPLLGGHYFDVLAMVEAARDQIAASDARPPLLTDGKPEVTLLWNADGIPCRSRIDWLRDDHTAIDDIKTSAHGANPDFFSRKTIYDYGYDVKCAFYLRALAAVREAEGLPPVETEWRWIVIESTAPYVVTVVRPDEETLAVGNAKVEYALALWRDCLANDSWPAYGTGVFTASPPPWELRWLETPELEETAWAQLS
jgi:hypothetical protein